MEFLLFNIVVVGLLLMLVARIVPGIEVDGLGTAFLSGLVIGVVSALLKPLLVLLGLPFIILTFGLFLLVINALLLKLAAAIVPGFTVRGFGSALLGALLLSLFTLGASLVL